VCEETNQEEVLRRAFARRFPGADPGEPSKAMDSEGNTLYHVLVREGAAGPLEALIKLRQRRKRGVAVAEEASRRREDGCTPLILAAETGNEDTVRLLLGVGADVNKPRPHDGVTACFAAGEAGHANTLRVLIGEGGTVNVSKKLEADGGESLVYAAVRTGSEAVLRVLIEAGVDVNRGRKKDGKTALMLAEENRAYRLTRILRAAGAFHPKSPGQSGPEGDTFPTPAGEVTHFTWWGGRPMDTEDRYTEDRQALRRRLHPVDLKHGFGPRPPRSPVRRHVAPHAYIGGGKVWSGGV